MVSTLQAWGPVADSRWKELLAIVEAEDQILLDVGPDCGNLKSGIGSSVSWKVEAANISSKGRGPVKDFGKLSIASSDGAGRAEQKVGLEKAEAAQIKKVHRRRPLLILFSHHNQPELLGAYRAIILAER